MRIPRIYSPKPLEAQTHVELDGQAAIHLIKVLRLKDGHPIVLFDGTGGHYPATIANATKRSVSLTLGEQVESDNESPLQTHIAVGVSKGDKMDLIVQKATELGVHSVTPLITARSDVKLNAERWQKKHEHWQQVAISACEQSSRDAVPMIQAPMRFNEWLNQPRCGELVICHPLDGKPLNKLATPTDITLAFGSEGGFTDEEVEQARQAGAQAITLGPRVLRAETAPLAALAICQSLWGDW